MKTLPTAAPFLLLDSAAPFTLRVNGHAEDDLNLPAGRFKIKVSGLRSVEVDDAVAFKPMWIELDFLSGFDVQAVAIAEPIRLYNAAELYKRYSYSKPGAGIVDLTAADVGIANGERWELTRIVRYRAIGNTACSAHVFMGGVIVPVSAIETAANTVADYGIEALPIPVPLHVPAAQTDKIFSVRSTASAASQWDFLLRKQ